MSVIKTLIALSFVAIVAGCAQQEEEVIMVDEPIMEEETMSKF